MQMKTVRTDEIIKIPASVAVCPICGAEAVIEDMDEWEQEDDGSWSVSEGGLHLSCITEPDIDSREWRGWFSCHFSMPYVDWLPLQIKIHKWLNANYRFVVGQVEADKLERWNAGRPITA